MTAIDKTAMALSTIPVEHRHGMRRVIRDAEAAAFEAGHYAGLADGRDERAAAMAPWDDATTRKALEVFRQSGTVTITRDDAGHVIVAAPIPAQAVA